MLGVHSLMVSRGSLKDIEMCHQLRMVLDTLATHVQNEPNTVQSTLILQRFNMSCVFPRPILQASGCASGVPVV